MTEYSSSSGSSSIGLPLEFHLQCKKVIQVRMDNLVYFELRLLGSDIVTHIPYVWPMAENVAMIAAIVIGGQLLPHPYTSEENTMF